MIDKDQIRVIIGIDTETDIGSWRQSYKGLEEGVPVLLDLLNTKKIKSTFFVIGEVAEKYPEICMEILKNGHEIGCHGLYHEVLGDFLFDIPGVKSLLKEEIRNRIIIATDLIKRATGKKPVSFRCPRLWGSTNCINILEELGYLADASYPMSFYNNQLAPYHPSKENWLEKGNLKILEIPNFADITERDSKSMSLDNWPLFRTTSLDNFIIHIKNFINMFQIMAYLLSCVFTYIHGNLLRYPIKFFLKRVP